MLALTAIRNTNAATGQAIVDETGAPLRRQLRLYLCSADASVTHPLPFVDPALGQALAQLLAMDVFILPMALWFRPELQLKPLDQLRGQVSTMPDGPITQDIHTLDSFADQFP